MKYPDDRLLHTLLSSAKHNINLNLAAVKYIALYHEADGGTHRRQLSVKLCFDRSRCLGET